MGHRQLLGRAVLAVGLASAVGAFAQGPPVPPGEEAPDYGGDEAEIETIIVLGNNRLRCPDGTKVTRINECPGFIQSWLNRVYRLPWDPITHVIRDSRQNAPTCGTKADASCVCGGGKVKAYDDSNDTFHCKPAPPDAGCPEWGNTFDFDLSVWKCVPKPAGEYMGKIKDCLPPGSIPASYWDHVPYIRWNNNLKNAKGEPVLGTTYISGSSIVGIEFNYGNMVASAPGASMSVTDAANLMIHDELIHVRDVVEYGGSNAWEQPGIEAEMEEYGEYDLRPFTKEEYEEFTFIRALGEIQLAHMKPAAECLGSGQW